MGCVGRKRKNQEAKQLRCISHANAGAKQAVAAPVKAEIPELQAEEEALHVHDFVSTHRDNFVYGNYSPHVLSLECFLTVKQRQQRRT